MTPADGAPANLPPPQTPAPHAAPEAPAASTPPSAPTSAPTPAPPQFTSPARAVLEVEGRTASERFRETLWRIVGQPAMRATFHNWYGLRRSWLALFGANIHPTARIRPSVRISYPWRLAVGAHSAIGDHAILFCLGPITIGKRCTISQHAHLCSGSHDYSSKNMDLVTKPIVIEDDAWIAADVFVGPGVRVGRDCVVGARSTVFHSLPDGMICGGDNAKPLRKREIRWPPPVPAKPDSGSTALPLPT